jgi:hypothetical protein
LLTCETDCAIEIIPLKFLLSGPQIFIKPPDKFRGFISLNIVHRNVFPVRLMYQRTLASDIVVNFTQPLLRPFGCALRRPITGLRNCPVQLRFSRATSGLPSADDLAAAAAAARRMG